VKKIQFYKFELNFYNILSKATILQKHGQEREQGQEKLQER
jgi:hypothetical protein